MLYEAEGEEKKISLVVRIPNAYILMTIADASILTKVWQGTKRATTYVFLPMVHF